MPTFLTYPLAFIGVLGVLVVVHEFGHYAAAKLLGVRVETFSVGFGPRLFGFRRGDTDYRISAIPLGGYVRMSGENPMDQHTDDPAEFLNHPRWHRFLIAIAGPAANIVLAVGLLTAINMVHYSRWALLDEPAVIGWVEENSAAAKAGLGIGDRIVRVDEIENPTWEQVFYRELLSPGQTMKVTVQQASGTRVVDVKPETKGSDHQGYAGWLPYESMTVSNVEKDLPGAKAGILPGDEVVALDGVPAHSWPGMIKYLQKQKGQPVDVTVLRQGAEVKFRVQPVLAPVEEIKEQRYRIGIQHTNAENVQKLPFAQAFSKSLDENRQSSLLAFELLGKLIRHKISMKQIDGPLRIGQVAGEAVQEKGWFPILGLTWRISLQLGIFNLLPIPILDGGVILLLLIEGLIRRDISLPVKERIYQVAFVFLIIFASVVIFNDVTKIFPGAAPKP